MQRFPLSHALPLASILFAACLVGTPAAAQDCEAKVGVVGPMTGGASAWGLATRAGTEFIAALQNEGGGLQMGTRKCRVKVVSYDAQYTAVGGAAAANALASQNVRAVVGPVGSPETAGFRTVAKRNGQLGFSAAYLVDAISPEYPLMFHAIQAPVTWGPPLAKVAQEQFRFRTVMVISPNDQAGTDSAKQFTKIYSDLGVKTSVEHYQRGTTNFAPIAQRVVNAKPEAIELTSVPPGDLIVLMKQLLEAGYPGVIGNLGGSGLAPIVQAAGGVDKLKAVYWGEQTAVDHPGIARMKREFERVMKMPPPESPIFPGMTLAAEQLVRAIGIAGTDADAEKIADALRKMTPESHFLGKAGWRGKAIYGINQELAFPVGLGMVVDGRKQPSRTVDIPAE